MFNLGSRLKPFYFPNQLKRSMGDDHVSCALFDNSVRCLVSVDTIVPGIWRMVVRLICCAVVYYVRGPTVAPGIARSFSEKRQSSQWIEMRGAVIGERVSFLEQKLRLNAELDKRVLVSIIFFRSGASTSSAIR